MAEMAHYAQEKDYRRWNLPHEQFHRGLTAHAGERINFVLGQMFDHAERYRRLHIGHGRPPGRRQVIGRSSTRARPATGI
jgi:DNA-binding GntR family transcriptional regulator